MPPKGTVNARPKRKTPMTNDHHRAAELHDFAAHAHRVAAESHGNKDHLTGHEQSRRALEHSEQAFQLTQQVFRESSRHPVVAEEFDRTATLAHQLWCERGCPEGSPNVDWHLASEQLRNNVEKTKK